MVQSRRERVIGLTLRLIVVGFAIAFALFPVLFIVLSAFNPSGQLASGLTLPKVDQFSDLFSNCGNGCAGSIASGVSTGRTWVW